MTTKTEQKKWRTYMGWNQRPVTFTSRLQAQAFVEDEGLKNFRVVKDGDRWKLEVLR